MNYYRFTLRAPIVSLLACTLLDPLTAQTENPHITGNVPIAFYGKVVDQDNHPVSNVTVRLDVRVGYFTSPTTGGERWDPVTLESDNDGNFVLSNTNGSFVQFTSIEKEGYKLAPAQVKANFMYYPRQFHPDSANPVVFKMWKKHGEEPLVGSSWHGKVACDGAMQRFDLLNGHPSADGNLEIICSRTPINLPPANIKPYTYRFQITVIGGGIQATDDEFTYLAPENGYAPSLTFGQTAEDPKWDRRTPIPKDYYIKTADGHYGRLSVDWDLAFAQSPTILKWDCSINPSGSRNLER